MNTESSAQVHKGGPGSGHFGHRGRPGKRGGSAPGVGDTRTHLLASDLLRDWMFPDEETVAQAYHDIGTLPGHFTKLELITPKEFPYSQWFETGPEGPLIVEVGAYDPDTRIIHLNPGLVRGPVGPFTLGPVGAHELGHHLINTRWPKTRRVDARLFSDFPRILDEELAFLGEDRFVAEYGLPLITVEHGYGTNEILADAYLARLQGTPSSWRNLRDLVLRYDLDLDEVFEP